MVASLSDIARLRLRNQRLTRPDSSTPEEIVSWLGAVQAQDYPGAKWAIGMRTRGATDAALDAAFDAGRLLRTHVMRPTWHFVPPADIRWMLALTAPRVLSTCASYFRQQELDDRVLKRSRTVLERTLRDGKHLTRPDLGVALKKGGIPCSPLRLAFVIMRAELDAVVCSGPKRGKQFTYGLLEERAPAAKPRPLDEALAELTKRYFSSHGPATLRDFVWWSGLTVKDAKKGVEMAAPTLSKETIDGLTYWFVPARVPPQSASPPLYLLPTYDECLIAYKDRGVALDGKPQPDVTKNPNFDPYSSFLVIEGRLQGTWRRTIAAKGVSIAVRTFRALGRDERRVLDAQVERYGKFMETPVTMSVETPK